MRRKVGKVKAKLKLYENGKFKMDVTSVAHAKRVIEGNDMAMATVDCDFQHYQVKQGNKIVFNRPRIHVP